MILLIAKRRLTKVTVADFKVLLLSYQIKEVAFMSYAKYYEDNEKIMENRNVENQIYRLVHKKDDEDKFNCKLSDRFFSKFSAGGI